MITRPYRPEIDGLRAVAVLSVVLFHAGVPWLPGGFVGVDVFFVISGFLITSILLAERSTDTFTFARFYARRARRILPLLIVVCAVCVPVAVALMLPRDLKDAAASLVGAATFTLNLIAANNVGYFDRAAEAQPLLHIWSLAVEEQYYLFFPVLLAVLWRFGLRVIAGVLLALIVAGVVAAEVWLRRDPGAAFYLLPTRGWTILLGALAAMLPARPPHQVGSLLGLGCIVVAILGFGATTPFPGLTALLPTVGAVLVIVFAGPGTVAHRVLSARAFVGLGLISYGIYLWHNPVLAFSRYGRDEPAPLVMAGLVVLTVALAGLTWWAVEQPFRKPGFWHRRAVSLVTAGSLVLICVGVAGVVLKGLPQRFDAQTLAILAAEDDRNPNRRTCSSNGPRIIAPVDACVLGTEGPVTSALLGDSHADALAVPLAAALRGTRTAQYTYSGCPMAPGIDQTNEPGSHCAAYAEAIYSHLAQSPQITTVILAARWTLYLEGSGFDNGEGGIEAVPPAPYDATPLSPTEAARKTAVAAAYQAAVARLLAMGKTVILITPVPEVGWDAPRHMAFAHLRDLDVVLDTSYDRFVARNAATLAALVPDPVPAGLIVIRPDAILCNTDVPGRCVVARDGIPLYADADHLTNRGAALIVAAFAPYLAQPPN